MVSLANPPPNCSANSSVMCSSTMSIEWVNSGSSPGLWLGRCQRDSVTGPAYRLVLVVRDNDVIGRPAGTGEERHNGAHTDGEANPLGADEARHRAGGDAGEG